MGEARGHSHFRRLVSRVRTSLIWLFLRGDQVMVFVLDRGWVSWSMIGELLVEEKETRVDEGVQAASASVSSSRSIILIVII